MQADTKPGCSHNPEVAGSSPALLYIEIQSPSDRGAFLS